MYKFLFIGAALFPLSMAQFVGLPCSNGAPLPTAVTIPGCTTTPCSIKNSQTFSMKMTFTAGYPSTTLTNSVQAWVGGKDVGFQLPAKDLDACASSSSITCPLTGGETIVYDMDVLINAPVVGVLATIEYSMKNQNGDVLVCFRANANIVCE